MITRKAVVRTLTGGTALLVVATAASQRPLPARLEPEVDADARVAVVDRAGLPLTRAYAGQRWNLDDRLPLEAVPPLLRTAIVEAEDRRFYGHHGIDWPARAAALWQNLRARRAVRGASTLSEQVVRLLHPRPRTLWSRWVEGFEALRLEARFSKDQILAFYLDQVPFAANRRGVVQAARYAFGRELSSLSESEMLALAVMPRAPSRLDPAQRPEAFDGPVRRLAARMQADGLLDAAQVQAVQARPVAFRVEDDAVPAAQALAELRRRAAALGLPANELRSSLDARLQTTAQALLDARVQDLARAGARQGGVLVVDLQGRKVRAWAVADGGTAAERGIGIDTVQTARQPGSALKPFVYALALESGWTAATRIDDGALAVQVGSGLHAYRNYSRLHYGAVTLREALGNSLNVPAVKALQFVGPARMLDRLHRLGMQSLAGTPEFYGDGLALGNGEITLYELVKAYAALADRGRFQPLTLFESPVEARAPVAVIDPAVASLVTDILSDARARRLEFGEGGLLRFPAQTAVKTGTSTDYRDAWCVAYDGRFVVGAWIGDLSERPMDGVTGAIGPALLVRSVFAELGRQGLLTAPLWRSPALVARDVGQPDGGTRREWFLPPPSTPVPPPPPPVATPQLRQPVEGLRVAIDPRVPPALQALEFQLDGVDDDAQAVEWFVDGQPLGRGRGAAYRWPLARGDHAVQARDAGHVWQTALVHFRVR